MSSRNNSQTSPRNNSQTSPRNNSQTSPRNNYEQLTPQKPSNILVTIQFDNQEVFQINIKRNDENKPNQTFAREIAHEIAREIAQEIAHSISREIVHDISREIVHEIDQNVSQSISHEIARKNVKNNAPNSVPKNNQNSIPKNVQNSSHETKNTQRTNNAPIRQIKDQPKTKFDDLVNKIMIAVGSVWLLAFIVLILSAFRCF